MKPVELLHVFYEPAPSRRQHVGRLARKQRELLFEYDTDFLKTQLELSPFKLPARLGVITGDPLAFGGLMGVFDDSLPDGWGRLLLDRKMALEGLSPALLGPLDRLAWVGARGMGALVYEPEFGTETPTVVDLATIAREIDGVLEETAGVDFEQLFALGGSPQGARPKILVQLSQDGNTILQGAGAIRPGFVPYLVKFLSKSDDKDAGSLELAYMHMAAAAGILVPETRMLGRSRRHPGYFATRRFDRIDDKKVHTHTLCGLLHAPHTHASLSYQDLLAATLRLTRDEGAVREMFRRCCFNVFAHNRDDHTKNFAFVMDEHGIWSPSPAYDLTFSFGPGGEHTLIVGNEGKNPTAAHLKALAADLEIRHANDIVDEVRSAVDRFPEFAEAAGLPKKGQQRVAKILKSLGKR